MATNKTLNPTGVSIAIPAMADKPDASVFSNCIDKEADAINTLNSNLNGLIKTQTFTAHANETWGTIPLPSGITADRVLFCYPTGVYGYRVLECRGDGNMFCWFFNRSGVAEIVKDQDVSGVIVYR